jgi:hypothetical protein
MERESSRYDLQNMSWEEAAAIWVPELVVVVKTMVDDSNYILP